MESKRLTRRMFIRRGGAVASAVAVGLVVDSSSAAGGPDSDLTVGRFVRAQGPRAAVISDLGGNSVPVSLDSAAFVVHGADGVVDTIAAFLPGEEVVVRGARSAAGVAALEFQSVYTAVVGTVSPDRDGGVIATSSGQVRVPPRVVQRHAPSGLRAGEACEATIWTNPETGEATALDLTLTS
jgi:hypothetical protein